MALTIRLTCQIQLPSLKLLGSAPELPTAEFFSSSLSLPLCCAIPEGMKTTGMSQVLCKFHQQIGFAWMFFPFKQQKPGKVKPIPADLSSASCRKGLPTSVPALHSLTFPSWKPSLAPLSYYLGCGTMELMLQTTPESAGSTWRSMPTLRVILSMNLSPGIILLVS